MNWVDLEFMGTYAYYGKNSDPFIYSDIPRAMVDFGYPNETRWKLITMLNTALSHVGSGAKVNQVAYARGFADSCEMVIAGAENIVKRQAISQMSIGSGSIPNPEITATTKSLWVKSAIQTLAKQHKKSGLILDRSYQVGSYHAHQKLRAVIEMHRDSQLANSELEGSSLDVEC